MRVRAMMETDKAVFTSMCEVFYGSGATTRGFNAEICEKTFSYLMSKHENLWGYLFEDAATDEIFGYALVTSYWCNEDGGNVLILDELFVDKQHRHHGYAQQFFAWLEREFHDKAVSITLEVLTTNAEALQLYSKLGYAEDGFEVLTKKL